jgi:hypothetical protein
MSTTPLYLIKQYIQDHKEQMQNQGLQEVYIRENEDLPSVIFILHTNYDLECDLNYEYWRKVREETRESGAEFVSNFYKDDPCFRIDGRMTRFI